MYAACCHGKYKRVPPILPDHFSSDSHGDETGSIVLIICRKNTTKDGWTRVSATTMNDISVRKIKYYVAI